MNKSEIQEILKNGESSKVEFKTDDVHPSSLAEEIVAFANFEGGRLFIGIDDTGIVKGCKKSDIEEFVINVCRNNIKPSIIPIIEKYIIDEKKLFIVTIKPGDTAYSTNKGLYYIRVGSTKQVPSQQELLRLLQKKNMIQIDESPILKESVDRIDVEKVNKYLVKLGQSPLENEEDKALSYELLNLSILVNIDENLYPTLAGLLSFGKYPQKNLRSFNITCGVYKGDDFLSETISEKEINGTFDNIIEDTLTFLKLSISQDHTLDRKTQRKDTYQYPVEALREGIVNALCHRDYTITGSSVRIFIFNNRIEIRSPGGLPNTLTLENIKYRQFSRNQMIASFLSGYGYMERRGKGILLMIKLCNENNIKCQLELTPDKTEFIVIFEK